MCPVEVYFFFSLFCLRLQRNSINISFRFFVHIKFFNMECVCVCVYIYIKQFIINTHHTILLRYSSLLLPSTSVILFFYLQPYKYVFVYSTFFFLSNWIYFVYLCKLISLSLIQFRELLRIINCFFFLIILVWLFRNYIRNWAFMSN